MLLVKLSVLIPFSLLFCITVSAQNLSEAHTKIRNAVESKDYQTAVVELQTLEQKDKKNLRLIITIICWREWRKSKVILQQRRQIIKRSRIAILF